MTTRSPALATAAFDFFLPPPPQAASSKIVFASDREGSMQIYAMNPDASGVTRLTYSNANDDCPRWSPNGAKILFQSDRDHPDTGYADIYVMNTDGSGVVRLTNDANDDSMAAWSPDGTEIVFQSMRNGVNYQVYSMNADGSNQMNLTNNSSNDGQPSSSPDGSKIAFTSDRDHADFDSIYVMNSNGTNAQRLTYNSGDVEDMQPAWSRDGSRIAFTSTRDSTTESWQETDDEGNYITKSRLRINKEVYVMNANGSGQARLTNDLANDDSPSWSFTSLTILFRSDRERECCDPSSQVWSMNADGTNQIDVSNSGSNDYSASLTSDIVNSGSQLASNYSGGSNQPPVANAGGSYVAGTGQAVQLNGGGSFDPDGSIVNYSWNFGDGTSGTGSVVNHQYVAPGVYPVSLAVTDNGGTTTSAQGFVTVDAVAFPVKLTFDELPNETVVADQYLNNYGVRFSSGNFFYPVHTKRDCGLTCGPVSFPNFISTKPDDAGQVIVTFAQPVSNLVFYAVGVDTFSGTFAFVDLYRNGSVTPSNTFAMNGIFNPTVGFTSGSLDNIDKVVIRGITDAAGIGFDDFSFTESADVKITNPRITASLNGTTQKSLVGANIVLSAAPTPGVYAGGTYSWSFTGPTYSVTSGCQSSPSCTIRPTATGTLTAKLTYTKNGMEVTPTVNINVTLPTLTNFTAFQAEDQLNRDQGCGDLAGVTHTLDCQHPGSLFQSEVGIVWNATATIPSATYLSDPAESGIKFVQAVDTFIKRLQDGNRQCFSKRVTEFGEGWQLDTTNPYNHNAHPPQYFSQGNTLNMGDWDAPGYIVEAAAINRYSDATYIDMKFETYVYYFTSNPAGRNPQNPTVIYERVIPLQGSPYPYAALSWSFSGHTVFDYFSSPSTLLYTLNSQTDNGPKEAHGTNEIKSMATNFNSLTWQPCIDSAETNNPIDGSKLYTAQLYRDFFEREPDNSGWNFWRSYITRCGFDAECIERERVHIGLAQIYSIEYLDMHPQLAAPRGTHDYNEDFVYWCYRTFLRREPEDPPDNNLIGYYFWVNKLDSTNPDYGDEKYGEMVRAFINSIEYRQRFGP